ncbi:MAG: MBL fold metallo-hydrolase [Magnetococcus sp. XQGC-1]
MKQSQPTAGGVRFDTMTPPLEDFPHGITRIDTGYVRRGFAACYLLVEAGEAVIIETGPRHAVPIILHALASKGVAPEAVRAVIVTHVHLDHAGGAGELLQHLPQARLLVHPRGLPHLLDPAKLQAGSEAVYGRARFQELLGGVHPAEPQRTMESRDNEIFSLPGRPLTILHTPGHALHHQCIWDPRSGGLFTGDAFGISYRLFDRGENMLLFPATTPVQFDPETSHHTLERLAALAPEWIFLTHFGRIPFASRLTERLHHLLDRYVALAHAHREEAGAEGLIEALQQLFQEELARFAPEGMPEGGRDWLTMDCTLNAQGLRAWLARIS